MAYDFPSSPTVGQIFQGWTWDGEKWLQTLATPNTGGVVGIQVFTSSGTYTPSASMTTCVVECVGGGGAGGGSTGAAGVSYLAAGGGGGGYSRSMLTAASVGASKAIVIGAGGAVGAAGASGGAGGQTTFGGTLVTANGGSGGIGGANASVGITPGGAAGTGDLATPGPNAPAGVGGGSAITIGLGGGGAPSMFGGGGGGGLTNNNSASGNPASGYGSGGGGGSSNNSATSSVGGAGRPGLVIITEYGITTLGSAATTAGAVRFDVAQGLTSNQMAQARVNIGIASYTVAALPAGTTGAMVFATNCRMFNGAGVQEGAGAGTGGLVTYNGTAWKIAGTNVTAVA